MIAYIWTTAPPVSAGDAKNRMIDLTIFEQSENGPN